MRDRERGDARQGERARKVAVGRCGRCYRRCLYIGERLCVNLADIGPDKMVREPDVNGPQG